MNFFSDAIIRWFDANQRSLPWRNTQNPYFIWLSEIILQQTRVAQGMAYYEKFVAHYPTVQHLAQATQAQILKDWQGLGYYSRARNLHGAAQYIAQDLGGVFPDNFEDLKKLKGVGTYTAAAIASFAYNLPHAVVDGNVYRVLSRYLGLHTPIDAPHAAKYYQNIAQNLLNTHLPAAHNQAIMELGALCCTPAQPQCPQCPLVTHCAAYKAQEMDILPIKQKKMVKKNRYFNYIVLRNDDGIYLKKRTTNDVWQDLHDFFLIESPENLLSQKNIEQHLNHSFEVQNIDYKLVSYSKIYKQTLTHQHIWALFWVFDIFFDVKGAHNLELCNLHAVNLLPVSRLVELFLTENITLIKAT